MVENEVVFRQYNERIQQGFDEIKKIAEEDGQNYMVQSDDDVLFFYCECSDENCKLRIQIRPSRYNEIHRVRDQFIVRKGHQVEQIEEIISKQQNFYVVKKRLPLPPTASKLQPTDIHNV